MSSREISDNLLDEPQLDVLFVSSDELVQSVYPSL